MGTKPAGTSNTRASPDSRAGICSPFSQAAFCIVSSLPDSHTRRSARSSRGEQVVGSRPELGPPLPRQPSDLRLPAQESFEVVGHERAEPEPVIGREVFLDRLTVHSPVAVQVAPTAPKLPAHPNTPTRPCVLHSTALPHSARSRGIPFGCPYATHRPTGQQMRERRITRRSVLCLVWHHTVYQILPRTDWLAGSARGRSGRALTARDRRTKGR